MVYVYIWLHSLLITAVNAWFLYRRDLKVTRPETKFIQLKRFIADVAEGLVNTKRSVGRPSLDDVQPPPKKAARVQGDPSRVVKEAMCCSV